MCGALGHDNVVARLIGQVTVVRLEDALAVVHEVGEVTVGVTAEDVLGSARCVDIDRAVGVIEDPDGLAFGLAHQGIAVEVEGVGPERTLDVDPAGGRVEAIEMGAGTAERVAAMLLLVEPFRHPDMGLVGGLTATDWVHVAASLGAALAARPESSGVPTEAIAPSRCISCDRPSQGGAG